MNNHLQPDPELDLIFERIVNVPRTYLESMDTTSVFSGRMIHAQAA